jgi:type VI secretion system secreted protein Hcp
MANDMFLKIHGIEGESEDASHQGEIDVIDWTWEVSQKSSVHMGAGGGAAKATVEDFQFSHFIDRATPNLTLYCLTGKHIDEVVFYVRKAGEKPLEYMTLTMHDAIVTKVASQGQHHGEERPLERVRLSFARLKQEYVVQNAQGGSAGAVTATFDIKKNTP